MLKEGDLIVLEKLIATAGGLASGSQSTGPSFLLHENLEAARRSFLGSMPAEYRASLGNALAARDCIADKDARADMKGALQALLNGT